MSRVYCFHWYAKGNECTYLYGFCDIMHSFFDRMHVEDKQLIIDAVLADPNVWFNEEEVRSFPVEHQWEMENQDGPRGTIPAGR